MKGVGLLIPISFSFEVANVVIVGFGLGGRGEDGGSWKRLGIGGRGNPNAWKGEVVSWSTGCGLKKRRILKVLVPQGTVLCLGRFGSTPIHDLGYQYLLGAQEKPSCLFLVGSLS